jgi:decaprenylphospho-beta-D-ribofuranose 2-oxidase
VIKRFKSIDGFFNHKLRFENLDKISWFNKKKISIFGSGNSISNLPFEEKSILLKDNSETTFKINKKKLEFIASGNIKIYKIHNELIKNSFYVPSFPSYPTVSLGACVANSVHGLHPQSGCLSSYIKQIKIYNPNFGFKILTKKKNQDLFNLTIGGMGLTGIILEVTIKILRLKSTFFKIKTHKFNSLLEGYLYLKKSKFLYNQNNFFLEHSDKKFGQGIISSGNFFGKEKIYKNIQKKNISHIRLGILKYSIFRIILKNILVFIKTNFDNKIKHINEIFYPSNQKLFYFNLLSPKFIEHQVIIPKKNIKFYLDDLKKITIKFKPSITLCHLKIFSGTSHHLQFNDKGLGLTIHLLINKRFNLFYKQLQEIDLKYKCKINLYKNSTINMKLVKKNYPKIYKIFNNKIKKINKKIYFTNNIFSEKFYND